jgi:23S rRNA (guanine745-N1)-methyltransferase
MPTPQKKKIDLAKVLFSEHSYLFSCPVCGTDMSLGESASLCCSNKHSFDLARQGYVNLLPGKAKASKYDQILFKSRLALHQSGFFSELLSALASAISTYVSFNPGEQLVILDAGCGEGSHLAHLVTQISSQGQQTLGIGLDIAKDGIRLAAATHSGLLWCVADLARSPLQAAQFDVILNILSPANYAEFRRLLKPGGMVIKVIPGPNYLQELRTILYADSSKESYQNEDSLQHFAQQFELLDSQHIDYQQELIAATLGHLLQMTPLAWSAQPAALEAVRQTGLKHITIDLATMVGR